MPLGDADAAAREAAAAVPVLERTPKSRWNGPGPCADRHDMPSLPVAHHCAARVTGESSRRFRGNVRAVLQHRLSWLCRVGQYLRVDMDHHLIPLARGTRIEGMMQRRLRDQDQRICLLLGDRRRPRHQHCRIRWRVPSGLLIEHLTPGLQCTSQECPRLRRQPPPHHHLPVIVLIDLESAPFVLTDGLARFGPTIHLPPAPHDALDVGGCARAADRDETGVRLWGCHSRQRANLGIREPPVGQGLGEERQRPERPGHPHALPGGADVEPYPPAQPLRAGAEARVPPAPRVELADQGEQPRGGGVEVRGQLRDLVAEPVQLGGGWGRGQHGGCLRSHGESSLLLGRLYTLVFATPERARSERSGRRRMIFGSDPPERAPMGPGGPLGHHLSRADRA